MTFDRYTSVSRSLLELLRHASALRGVLLLEPSAVKSVMLKFIDSLVELQGEVEAPTPPPADEVALVFRLQRLLGLRRRRRKQALRTRQSELRGCVDTLAQVLDRFRHSVALLDEVDVLLHPLRSELNWPQVRSPAVPPFSHLQRPSLSAPLRAHLTAGREAPDPFCADALAAALPPP